MIDSQVLVYKVEFKRERERERERIDKSVSLELAGLAQERKLEKRYIVASTTVAIPSGNFIIRASPTGTFELFYFTILKLTLSFIPYHFTTLPTSLNSIFFAHLFKYSFLFFVYYFSFTTNLQIAT